MQIKVNKTVGNYFLRFFFAFFLFSLIFPTLLWDENRPYIKERMWQAVARTVFCNIGDFDNGKISFDRNGHYDETGEPG